MSQIGSFPQKHPGWKFQKNGWNPRELVSSHLPHITFPKLVTRFRGEELLDSIQGPILRKSDRVFQGSGPRLPFPGKN